MSQNEKKDYEPKIETLLDLFDNNIVSTYTDQEAIEDGGLVALNQKDRVSRAAFEFLAEFAPSDARPPADWPVDLMGWFRAKNKDAKALAMAVGLISTRGPQARRVYEENIGGGIFAVWAVIDQKRNKLNSLLESEYPGAKKLWIIPNENGGLTLLFPEDY